MPGDDPETPGVDESGGVDSVAAVAASGQSTAVGEGAGDYYDPFSVTTEGSDPTIQDFVAAGLNPQDLGVTPDPGGPLGGGNVGETDPVFGGVGSLLGNVTPDSPDLMTILTAPLEALISFFTFGLVDPEFTGKDVFSLPGASSSDFSRAMAGKQGPQPVGVEVGLPMIGGFEFNPGSGIKGTGIFGGDKEAQFSMDPNQPSKSIPTDMLTHFTEIVKNDPVGQANPELQQMAAEKVQAAAGAAQNLATNYQQMDLGAEEARTPAQQALVDAHAARNQAGAGETVASASAPLAEVPFAGRSRGPGGVMPGSGNAKAVDPGLQDALTARTAGGGPGYSKLVQEQIPGRQGRSGSRQYAGDRAILGEYPNVSRDPGQQGDLGGDRFFMDPTIGAREKLAAEAVMEKMAMQQPPAYRDMSAPYDPMAYARARQDERNQAAEYQRAADMFRQDLGTPVLGFNDPDTLAVQGAGDKMRSFLSDLYSRVSNLTPGRYAGGGPVRGPVTGGQRSRGIMSLR